MLKHILGLVEEGGNAVIEEEDDDDIPLVKNYCMLYTKYFPRCTERLNDYKLLLFFGYCEIPQYFRWIRLIYYLSLPPKDSYRSHTQFYISSTTINNGFIINKVEGFCLFIVQ